MLKSALVRVHELGQPFGPVSESNFDAVVARVPVTIDRTRSGEDSADREKPFSPAAFRGVIQNIGR